jgi:phosphopantothenoylcysteine synthetase/decarboxylase
MNILVTAGNTQVLIDRVRCLTNVFTGRTGTDIALDAYERGHTVTLFTSRPELVLERHSSFPDLGGRWSVRPYLTFDDLQSLLSQEVRRSGLDAVIHTAAVSDYLAGGVFAPAPGTSFDSREGHWHAPAGSPPALLDRSAAKVKSDEPELWLRLIRAPKLVDRIRTDWGFLGVLVKFKLEVGTGVDELLAIAERSRQHSGADLMVANTLEGAGSWACLGPVSGHYQRVDRRELAHRLLEVVERIHEEKSHG